MPPALASQIRLAAFQVRSRYHHRSLPLLACHERQHQDSLAHVATQHGGVIVARDGCAPHRGCLRELARGLLWRRGGLYPPAQPPFEAFLAPQQPLEWPLLAVSPAPRMGAGRGRRLASSAPSMRAGSHSAPAGRSPDRG